MNSKQVAENVIRAQYNDGTINGEPVNAYRKEDRVDPQRDSISLHLANRLLLPQSVKWAMQFADVTNDVKERADRLQRAEILDTAAFDIIKHQYDTLRELSTRNN